MSFVQCARIQDYSRRYRTIPPPSCWMCCFAGVFQVSGGSNSGNTSLIRTNKCIVEFPRRIYGLPIRGWRDDHRTDDRIQTGRQHSNMGMGAQRSPRWAEYSKREKATLEGALATKRTLLGLDIDTNLGAIEVPPVKVMGARTMLLSGVYKPGIPKVELRDVQVLRGLCQHWIAASLYWEITLQWIDAILRYADEADDYISCDEPDVWISYWDILEVLRVTAEDELRWERLPMGKICNIVEFDKRFPGPRRPERSGWITSDATLHQTAAVYWHRRPFFYRNSR